MFVYDSAVAVLEIVDLVVELDVIKFGDVVPCNTLVTKLLMCRIVYMAALCAHVG